MGFFQQLGILLWKNFTLKKRSPFITVLELILPLLLIAVLVILRSRLPIDPKDATFAVSRPLPSAGYIPLLQQFCPSGVRDSNGFRGQPNSIVDQTIAVVNFFTNVIEQLLPVQLKQNPSGPAAQLYLILQQISNFDRPSNANIDLLTLWNQNKPLILGLFAQGEILLQSQSNAFLQLQFMALVQQLQLSQRAAMRNFGPLPDQFELPDECYALPNYPDKPKRSPSNGTESLDGDQPLTKWFDILVQLFLSLQGFICEPTPQAWDVERVLGKLGLSHLPLPTNTKLNIIDIVASVLDNNPKILFAPTGTEADRILQRMLGSLSIIQDLVKYSKDWLKLSAQIKEDLNNTIHSGFGVGQVLPQANVNPLSGLNQFLDDSILTSPPPLTPSDGASDSSTRTTTRWPIYTPAPTQPPLWKSLMQTMIDFLNMLDWGMCRVVGVIDDNLDLTQMFEGFPSEEALVDYYNNKAKEDGVTVVTSVVINTKKDGSLPTHITYKIRHNASFSQTTQFMRPFWWHPRPDEMGLLYYWNFFVWIQDLIERSIIDVYVDSGGGVTPVMEPGIYVEEQPTPCYRDDNFQFMLEHMFPLAMMLSWVFPVAMLVRSIVYEKEARLKEVMKLMGMQNSVHWVGWFITSFIQSTITVAILTVMFVIGNIFHYTDGFLLFIIVEIYALNAIMFAFLISTFFSKAKIGAACAGIFFMLTYVPYMCIAIMDNGGYLQPSWLKALVSIFGTTSLGLISKPIAYTETAGVGTGFANVDDALTAEYWYSTMTGMLIMLGSTFVFLILTWYIDNIKPGEYGIPRPWYFPFTRTYWCGQSEMSEPKGCYASLPKSFQTCFNRLGCYNVKNIVQDIIDVAHQETVSEASFEMEPVELPLSISLKKMTKIYGNGKVAVNNLSVNLYENQILSFLGHNGAGKTTTMSMLTGMIPCTAGTAYVYDMNIRTDIDIIRQNMGMCPQYNVLFDGMTVEEHLRFYARIKGTRKTQVDFEVESMLQDTGLQDKRKSTVDALSGGMKRKLSIGIAFISGSRTVILDEPTAGVDPYSRREIWDLILKYKQGRTIMLSTHHMDEADILGDRIAIISHGNLKCCGSSLYLKSTFGEGYHLTMAKKMLKSYNSGVDDPGLNVVSPKHAADILESETVPILTHCSEPEVTAFVQSHVPEAYLKKERGSELHYILPTQCIENGTCNLLFQALERERNALSVDSYGVSDTSLEEVFLKVTHRAKFSAGEVNPSFASDLNDSISEQPSLLESAGKEQNTAYYQQMPQQNRHRQHGSARLKPHRRHKSEWPDPRGNLDKDNFPIIKRSQSMDMTGKKLLLSSQGSDITGSSSMGTETTESTVSLDSSDPRNGAGSYVVTGISYIFLQFYACLIKRFIFTFRNWKALLSQIFLPVIFVTVAMVVGIIGGPTIQDEPPLELSTTQYMNLSKDKDYNHVPFSDEGQYNTSFHATPLQMGKTFLKKSGFGASCCLTSSDWNDNNTEYGRLCDDVLYGQGVEPGSPARTFQQEYVNATNQDLFNNTSLYYPKCECHADKRSLQKCDDDYGDPPLFKVITTDTMQNITGQNITEFLYYTSENFKLSRYGAISFGLQRSHVPYWLVKLPFELKRLFVKKVAKVWYNSRGWHAMPTYINAMHNAILRANLPASMGNPAAYGITVINHPMNGTSSIRAIGSLIQGSELVIAIFIVTGFAFIPAGFILFLVYEQSSKAKHLQFVSGLHPLIYWSATLSWDLSSMYVIYPTNDIPTMTTFWLFSVGDSFSTIFVGTFIYIAMSSASPGGVYLIVTENVTKAKYMQCIGGLWLPVYWLNNLIFDMLLYLVPAAVCLGVFKLFDIPAFTAGENYLAVCALVLVFGWGCIPMMYPSSFLFKEPSAAYVFLAVFNIFIGVSCLFVTFVLDYFGDQEELKEASDVIHQVFLVFPSYTLGRGLMDIVLNNIQNEVNDMLGTNEYKSPFSWDVTGLKLVALATIGTLCCILTLLMEYKFFIRPKTIPVSDMKPIGKEDADVAHERKRVLKGGAKNDMIILNNLSKFYTTRNFGKHLAVHRMCLGVPKGECFGMLGVNGAGKTTTFKMLTGDHHPSGGDATVFGYSILKDMTKVRQNIGYCPQFDALFEELTAEEHLALYARLRGVPSKDVKQVVDWAINKLELTQYAGKRAGTYSGGNKRKLSTAISLVGNPSVIFLDEPTSGMDPYAKRFLWDLILNLVEEGRCIILTSHSMEECETLCTRLAIMVQGTFRCLGSVQHLKSRFGDGYSIKITVKGPDFDEDMHQLNHFMNVNFPHAAIKERHHNMIEYEFRPEEVKLYSLFAKMEQAKKTLSVLDYSVCQNTLDNVFVNFVKEQNKKIENLGAMSASQRHAARKKALPASLFGTTSPSQINLVQTRSGTNQTVLDLDPDATVSELDSGVMDSSTYPDDALSDDGYSAYGDGLSPSDRPYQISGIDAYSGISTWSSAKPHIRMTKPAGNRSITIPPGVHYNQDTMYF